MTNPLPSLDGQMADGPMADLHGRELIVAVCGGISAYKMADVVSKLAQAGAGVTVCMTSAAAKFITPLTFESLSGRKVRTDAWNLADSADPQHIALTEAADLMLVGSATANTLARVAHGFCDDLVSLTITAAACPVVFAPAMNDRMWANPITQDNVSTLRAYGYRFIGPEAGWLACRNVGVGRLSEPAKIVAELSAMLAKPRRAEKVAGE